ncbi:MAG: DUF1285 domain-containing protein [Hyphomicrobiales bacterium]
MAGKLPAGLAALVARAGPQRALPPIEKWNPPYCGAIDMRIAADGQWFYMGSPIGRMPLVRLFASVLKREGDDFFLVTPVEKVGIRVDDAPFLAVEMFAEGEGAEARLTFRTNVGDLVAAGADHPPRFATEAETGGLKPYIEVRAGLEALVSRSLVHDLVARAEIRNEAFGIWSGGVFFEIASAKDMETFS